jgi:hypothetical protein
VILKTSCHILVGKGSLPNRKSIIQKEVNNKIYTTCSNLYRMFFPNFDSSVTLFQHRPIPLNLHVKFQLDPMVGFGVMLNSVKVDNRKFYAKI